MLNPPVLLLISAILLALLQIKSEVVVLLRDKPSHIQADYSVFLCAPVPSPPALRVIYTKQISWQFELE
jgi:hypothetical protein